MASRYDTRKLGLNNTDKYSELMETRNVKQIRQYFTPNLKHLDSDEISQLQVVSHVWKTGDRYYKLAHKYYNDSTLWWVIAWFNQAPTESHLELGDIVEIPNPIEKVLSLLEL